MSLFFVDLSLSHICIQFAFHFQVYLHAISGFECVRVQRFDRLGIFIPVVPGSVAYTFIAPVQGQASYRHTPRSADEARPTVNQVITFDSLLFPYAFSSAAYIDTGEFPSPVDTTYS